MCGDEHDPLHCKHGLFLLGIPVNALLTLHAACSSFGVVYCIRHGINICRSEPNHLAAGVHGLLQMNVLRVDGCCHRDRVIASKGGVMVDNETKRSIDMSAGTLCAHRAIFRLSPTSLLPSRDPVDRRKHR